jgi:Putative heavy-metal-binding
VSEELPAGAVARAAGTWPGGTWGSALTCQEFAAVRGVGFEPLGQVFGAAVYAAGYARGYSCPGVWGSAGDRSPAGRATQLSGRGDAGSFGPLVEAMYRARQTAIDRMTAQCAALGGHGVVGVRLSRGSLPLGGLDFTAIGTAVRALGAAHGQRALFTCDVSGQDFAKLIAAGWVPAGLALGISIGSRHDDRSLRWRSVLVWHVGPAARWQCCIWIARARAAESGPGGPESVRVIVRLTGKAI